MKKLLLSLGAVAAVVAPVASVVACGSTDSKTENEANVEVTFQNSNDTRTATLDFGDTVATKADLEVALKELDGDVRTDLGDIPDNGFTGFSVEVTLKSNKTASIIADIDELALGAELTNDTIDKAIEDIIAATTDVDTANKDGWVDCFDEASTN